MTCLTCCGLKGPCSANSGSQPSFEYLGKSRLAVIGTQTGKTYHFERPGAVLLIDARDRAGFANIPVLREIGRSAHG